MNKSTLVIDTSVIIKWLSSENEQNLDQADAILRDVEANKVELLAPELVRYEVGNVLLFGKKLSLEQVNISLTEFYNIPITLITESNKLAKETFKLAHVLGITYYDSAFLSLAKLYDATLITDNIKHQGKSTEVKVISLKDY